MCQDVKLLSAEDHERQANMCFHFRQPPSIVSWLTLSQSKDDRQRLQELGNLVIPCCAAYALNVIGRSILGKL